MTQVFVWNICTCERVTHLPVVWCSHLHGSAYKGWAGKRTRWVSVQVSSDLLALHDRIPRLFVWEYELYFFSCDQKPWGLMGIVSLYLVLHFWLGTVGGKTEHIFDQSHTYTVQYIRAVSFPIQILIPALKIWKVCMLTQIFYFKKHIVFLKFWVNVTMTYLDI